jgi:XTP/dITP diphosphohydrolase
MEIIFATKNKGKLIEIKNALETPADGIHIISMEEAGITADVSEDGSTYEANALKKAKAVCGLTGMITLADDSGLEIDCLARQPGVYSARWLGEHMPYAEKNRMILERISSVPDERRTARFVCVIAAAFSDGGDYVARGVIEGLIAHAIGGGENGFGYDPIFYLPEYGAAMSELSIKTKNAISHRGQAIRKMKAYIMAKEGRLQ